LPVKKKGVTLFEALVVVFILSLVLSGVLMGLKTGEFFFPLSAAKIDLHAKVRNLMNWITKDARQAPVWSIANNGPTDSYIKFQQVQGLDTTTGQYVLSSDYIEYTYDSTLNKIVRNVIDPAGIATKTWEAGDITQPPFYTRDSGGAEVALNKDDLNSSGKLIILLNGQKQVRGALNVPYSLRMEVKIRNE